VRVVSLVPSMTETLLAWGIVPVACTRFCEQPSLHAVGGTKDPDVAAIVGLRPDLVVVDEEENRIEDHDELVAAGLDVHVLAVRSVADVDAQLGPLAERMDAHWEPVGEVEPRPRRESAFVPIWRRPWMGLGAPTYGSSLLQTLGVENILATSPYPEVSLDAVRALDPDVVLAPSEPYPFTERHRAELESVAPVHFVDGKDLFWWGARTAAAIVRLDAVIGEVRARPACE
jgi:ABC-type Fe3+-hydroxamate transport system substrate-binding protein